MAWAQRLTEALVVLNFFGFTFLSTSLFRLDRAGLLSYIFFASFLAATGSSLFFLHLEHAESFLCHAVALAAALISSVTFLGAARTIRSKPLTAIFSPDSPEFLHTSGPYSVVRHPFYTAYILNFFAAYFASTSVVCGALAVASLVVYGYAARVEENKFKRSNIAAEYQAYCHRTGMFFPTWKRP